MGQRKARITRQTRETAVDVAVNLDRHSPVKIATTIPFMDHMLDLFAHHGGLSLAITARGDTEIDDHHLVEDTGITLGKAFADALGKKAGIARYGHFLLPMDESLAYVALDLSGRPYMDFSAPFTPAKSGFDYELVREFLYAFTVNAGMTLHIKMLKGRNNHHIAEAIFKGLGRALAQAVSRTSTVRVPSTKGSL